MRVQRHDVVSQNNRTRNYQVCLIAALIAGDKWLKSRASVRVFDITSFMISQRLWNQAPLTDAESALYQQRQYRHRDGARQQRRIVV